MSRNEDYLDNLLTSVTDKLNEFDDDFEQNRESFKQSYQTQNDLPQKTQSALDEIREENFLREFEDEINRGSTDDDFLSEFERELSGEADAAYTSPQADKYVDQMEEIVDHSGKAGMEELPLEVDNMDTVSQMDAELEDLFKEDTLQESEEEQPQTAASQEPDQGEEVFPQVAKEQDQPLEAPKGMEGLEDIFGDFGDADSILKELEEGVTQSFDDSLKEQEAQPASDSSLTEILNESDEEAISEIGKLLDSADAGESGETEYVTQQDSVSGGPDFPFGESALSEEEPAEKKKERNKNGLFGKISRMLFGTPAELDPEAAAEYEAAKAALGQDEETDPKVLKEQKKKEKELKKQQKKEEAEKKKQEKEAAKAEKAAQKAAQKASKPKKEKKPKKKDKLPKEPPLPKVPVIMMWVLALSLMVFVFLGTSLVGYSAPVKESKEAFEQGDYVTAYRKLQGMKVRKSDESLLKASSVLAGIQTEMDAYHALMEQKQYEMALDCLVRGYNRCILHSAEAEEWQVSDKLKEMQDQFDLLLKEQFDVSKRKAKKLYKIKKRSEYTLELQKILEGLGMEY